MFASSVARPQTQQTKAAGKTNKKPPPQRAAPEAQPFGGVSWSLSTIPIFPPDRASQSHISPPHPAVIQPKLAIGAANDPLEHEADQVADTVMRMPDPAASISAATPQVSRKCAACEEEEAKTLRPKPAGPVKIAGGAAPAIVHETLRMPGRPLHASTRAFFEPRFGCDFSRVRVHADERAAESARSVGARAYTLGHDIAFNHGAYAPATTEGRRLLAHELTHVVQQGGARTIGSHAPRPVGENATGRETVRRDLPAAAPARAPAGAALKLRWTGTLRSSVFAFVKTLTTDQEEAARLTAKILEMGANQLIVDGKATTLQQFEARAARDKAFELQAGLTQFLLDYFKTDLAQLKKWSQLGELAEELTASLRGPDIPDTAAVARDRKEEKKHDLQGQAVTPAWDVLKDAGLARFFLTLMQQFADLKLTDELTKAAAQGLSQDDLEHIFAGNPKRRYLAGLFTQAWQEFKAAGGTTQSAFQPLAERIIEQTAWGNPTATHNLLKIGEGTPERGRLGIAHRLDGTLLYDEMGAPLPSFAGTMMRDGGYIGAKQFTWGIDISGISDPALKGILNALRQQAGDPTRAVLIGAQQYFDNMEYVNDIVVKGLDDEIIKRFQGMLPVVLGFMAGKGLSEVLLRLPPPWPLIGGAFKGLLLVAGYALQLEFLGSALSRLLLAGYHLSRIQRDGDQLTELSKLHVNEAAVPLRTLVADIAAIKLVGALMEGLRGGGGGTIKCASPCEVELDEKPERKETGAQKEKRELDEDRPQRPPKSPGYFDWEGGQRGKLSGFVSALRAHIRSITASGQPDPLPGLKSDVINMNAEQFIRSRPALKGTWDGWTTRIAGQLAEIATQRRAAAGDWRTQSALDRRAADLEAQLKELDAFGKGIVGDKRPDLIEVFFGKNRAVITDITQEVGDRLHGFKTAFYVEVIKALTGYSDVGGLEYDTPANQKVIP